MYFLQVPLTLIIRIQNHNHNPFSKQLRSKDREKVKAGKYYNKEILCQLQIYLPLLRISPLFWVMSLFRVKLPQKKARIIGNYLTLNVEKVYAVKAGSQLPFGLWQKVIL